MTSIAIVDYGMGNIWSIESALKYLGFEAKAINNPKDLIYFNSCILPGVGAYNHAMEKLVSQGFVEPIKEFVLNKEIGRAHV